MTDTTANEKIDRIANRCLELIEERLENLKVDRGYDAAREVRTAGEALKVLAEGIEGCKKVMKNVKNMETATPVH